MDTEGSYKQIIDAIIYYATQKGMAVILDLHWTETGRQSPMANRASIPFWKEVATAYKGFGTVIFELFNEPYGITKEVWLNGDETYAGMQELNNAVRSTGAENGVIINGLDYGYDLSFLTKDFHVQGTNIISGSHPYNNKGAPGYTGPGGDFNTCYAWALPNTPLIFTEFGDNQAQDYPNGWQEIYERIIAYANANGIHYTGFAWWIQADDPAFPALIGGDWANPVPINGGTLVFEDLIKNPGSKLFAPPPGFENTNSETSAKSEVKVTTKPDVPNVPKRTRKPCCFEFFDPRTGEKIVKTLFELEKSVTEVIKTNVDLVSNCCGGEGRKPGK